MFLNSPPVPRSLPPCLLQALLHKVSPLSIYSSLPSPLAPLPISMLKYLYILNGRKILFINLTYTSSHCLTSPHSLPTTLFESYLWVLITSQSPPAFWILPLSLHWTDSSLTYTLQTQWSFLFRAWPLNDSWHWWPLLNLNLLPVAPRPVLLMASLLHLWPFLSAFCKLFLCSCSLTDGIPESHAFILALPTLWESHHSHIFNYHHRLMTLTVIA